MVAVGRRLPCGWFLNPLRRRLLQHRSMADLYYTPTSCGAASYIAAYKAGILDDKLAAHQVDLKTHQVSTGPDKGKDFYEINPKGNVPAVVLDDKTVLNENSSTLQWIADQNPDSGLAPPNGTPARYLLQSKLSFVSSEIHASVGPLFLAALSSETKQFFIKRTKSKLEYVSKHELGNGASKFLLGGAFTVADSYLFIILSWMKSLGIDLKEFPVLKQYSENIAKLDFVQQARSAMNAAKKP